MSEEIQNGVRSRFKVIQKIGSGAYGHVFKVIDRVTRKVKALKKNYDAFHNSSDAQRTYRQIMFLMQLKHENIIILDQVIPGQNGRDIYLVFQYMEIDLHSLIRKKILSQKHIKFILYQIAKGLLYLHSAGVIHRDIKPSNILVNESCQVKICDFGLVRSVNQNKYKNQDILTQYIATRWYRAPQVMLGSRDYSSAIDVWSFGCLAAQMIKGKTLFPGTSTINQLQKILMWTGPPSQSDLNSINMHSSKQLIQKLFKVNKRSRIQFFQTIDPECLDLISKCLQFNPEHRYSFEQIVRHPYLSEYFQKSGIVRSNKKIKISIDDNRRLSLKDYKCLIQQFAQNRIEHLKNFNLNINNIKFKQASSKYRIRQPRRSIKIQQSQQKYLGTQLPVHNKQPQLLTNSQKPNQSKTVDFKYEKTLQRRPSVFQRSQSYHEKRLKNLQQLNNVNLITMSKSILGGQLIINKVQKQKAKQVKKLVRNQQNNKFMDKNYIQSGVKHYSLIKQTKYGCRQIDKRQKRFHTQESKKSQLGVYPKQMYI